mmetsp:Transcript_11523/g.26738  ORF Transcript_11523/g.26738 Transcript_11523/m.26738 type:complete len:343 (-) Transcript_11523:550-1578(-)
MVNHMETGNDEMLVRGSARNTNTEKTIAIMQIMNSSTGRASNARTKALTRSCSFSKRRSVFMSLMIGTQSSKKMCCQLWSGLSSRMKPADALTSSGAAAAKSIMLKACRKKARWLGQAINLRRNSVRNTRSMNVSTAAAPAPFSGGSGRTVCRIVTKTVSRMKAVMHFPNHNAKGPESGFSRKFQILSRTPPQLQTRDFLARTLAAFAFFDALVALLHPLMAGSPEFCLTSPSRFAASCRLASSLRPCAPLPPAVGDLPSLLSRLKGRIRLPLPEVSPVRPGAAGGPARISARSSWPIFPAVPGTSFGCPGGGCSGPDIFRGIDTPFRPSPPADPSSPLRAA